YTRYVQMPQYWRRTQLLPGPLRSVVLEAVGLVPLGFWNIAADLAGRRRSAQFGRNVGRAFKLMARSQDFEGLFDSFLDSWAMRGNPAANGVRNRRLALDPRLADLSLEAQMMH